MVKTTESETEIESEVNTKTIPLKPETRAVLESTRTVCST